MDGELEPALLIGLIASATYLWLASPSVNDMNAPGTGVPSRQTTMPATWRR